MGHGARAVQKLVDVVKVSPYVSRFFAALEGSISTLAKSSNGNHVVQRCLDSLPDSKVLIFSANERHHECLVRQTGLQDPATLYRRIRGRGASVSHPSDLQPHPDTGAGPVWQLRGAAPALLQ